MGTGAGTGLFTMFGYPLLEGSPTSALQGMKGIALSKKAAEQVFDSVHNAMGKTMRWDAWMDRFPTNRS